MNAKILSAPTAQTGYTNAQAIIEERLDNIRNLVQAHAGRVGERADWADAGDLATVAHDLAKIERFLNRQVAEPDVDIMFADQPADPVASCPECGESDRNRLAWRDDDSDYLDCLSCGKVLTAETLVYTSEG